MQAAPAPDDPRRFLDPASGGSVGGGGDRGAARFLCEAEIVPQWHHDLFDEAARAPSPERVAQPENYQPPPAPARQVLESVEIPLRFERRGLGSRTLRWLNRSSASVAFQSTIHRPNRSRPGQDILS